MDTRKKQLTVEDYAAFHQRLVKAVEEEIAEEGSTKLGLIFSGQGPAGVIQLRALLREKVNLPSVVICTNERLLRRQVAFTRPENCKETFRDTVPLEPADKVLLLTDAAASGVSICKAALIVRKFGARCNAAFALFDRQQGATEKLALDGIRLTSFFNRDFLLREGPDGLQPTDFECFPQLSLDEFASTTATVA